MTSHLYA